MDRSGWWRCGRWTVGDPWCDVPARSVAARRGKKANWIGVAEFASLSSEQPVKAAVIGQHVDAWTKSKAVGLGTVWLLVLPDHTVEALSAECPHLGCKVGFDASHQRFVCPCHDSAFALDGRLLGGPAPRGMDPLEARVRQGRVEVRYERFRAAIKERVEVG